MAIVRFNGADLANTASYSGATLPLAGDTLVIENSVTSINAGYAALAGIALDAVIIRSMSGSIGTTTSAYVQLDCDTFTYAGTGSVAKFDFGANAVDLNILGTGTSAADNIESLRLLGTAIGTVNVLGASQVCIAGSNASEVSTVSTLVVGSNASGTLPVVRIGRGLTLTTATVFNGRLNNDGANLTTLTINGNSAVYYVSDTATHTTVNISSGQMVHGSSGTVTTLNLSGGVFDCSQDPRSRAVIDANVSGGQILTLNNVTWTNPIVFTSGNITVS